MGSEKNKSNLKVLTVCRSLLRKSGGPATSVPSLCRELSRCGCDVSILTIGYDENDIEDCGDSKISVLRNERNITELIKESDIVHFSGIWPFYFSKVMKLCFKNKKKYIVSPRASLMLSDINKTYFKIIKKYVAWNLYLKNNLVNVSGFHVTATNEFEDLNRIGFNSIAAVVPNGINIEELSKVADNNILLNMFPKTHDKRILLFFSRIAPKKGLLLLAHAWGKIAGANPSWHLIIVGPDNENHWLQVKTILNSYNQDNYTRCDYLGGDARLAVLQNADIFILPTYWENFGIVVAEALMSGTPVITTTKTPWRELEAVGCGWTVEPKVESIVKVLNEAMQYDSQVLKEMGRKGRAYVGRQFDWHNIAVDMKIYYEYILGRRDKPKFVYQLEGNGNPSLPLRKPGLIHELA